MTKIYLLLQSQIIDLCEAGKIQEVVIERISLKQWYPIFDVKDENLGAGVIAQVFQKGYRLGDRVIRHTMVQVAN